MQPAGRGVMTGCGGCDDGGGDGGVQRLMKQQGTHETVRAVDRHPDNGRRARDLLRDGVLSGLGQGQPHACGDRGTCEAIPRSGRHAPFPLNATGGGARHHPSPIPSPGARAQSRCLVWSVDCRAHNNTTSQHGPRSGRGRNRPHLFACSAGSLGAHLWFAVEG
jgi:hypothetical protein